MYIDLISQLQAIFPITFLQKIMWCLFHIWHVILVHYSQIDHWLKKKKPTLSSFSLGVFQEHEASNKLIYLSAILILWLVGCAKWPIFVDFLKAIMNSALIYFKSQCSTRTGLSISWSTSTLNWLPLIFHI